MLSLLITQTTVTTVSQLVTSIGFPIVMCGAMAWFIKDTNDTHREQINELTDSHKQEMLTVTETYREEMANVKEALNNNTLALQKLCERMGAEVA